MNIIFMYKLGVFIKHNGIAKQYVGGRVDVKQYMTIIISKDALYIQHNFIFRHYIIELLLKVALNTIKPNLISFY